MKPLLTTALTVCLFYSYAQTSGNNDKTSDFDRFITKEGSLILVKSEEVYKIGNLDRSLQIDFVEASDATTKREAKAIAVGVNKSTVYLDKDEVVRLIEQMKNVQLLMVDGAITKQHTATFNIRKSVVFEVNYNESRKEWKYSFGVADEDRTRTRELSATEFQDLKASFEGQLEKL